MKPTTTRARLNLYRKRAADNKVGNNDWRTHRYGNTWGTDWHSGIRKDGTILTDNKDTLGDYLGDWTEFSGGARYLRDTNGFYTDSSCYGTMQGGVVRLRTAKFTLYIPCTYHSDWDGATLYFSLAERVERGSPEEKHDKNKTLAAATAFGRAEREAEEAREDDAKYRANEDIQEARNEIHAINKQARALLAEIRGNEFTQNVCAALRHRLDEYLAERRECFATIEKRQSSYWSAVY